MRFVPNLRLAAVVVVLLGGCSTAEVPHPSVGTSPAPVVISQTHIAMIGKGVLGGLEATAASYVLSSHPSAATQRQIAAREIIAENLANELVSVSADDFPDKMKASGDAMRQFMASIPTDRIPPSVMAGVTSYMGFADTLAPILRSPKAPIQIVD